MGFVCPKISSSANVRKFGFTGESARSILTFRPVRPRSAVVPHGFDAAVPAVACAHTFVVLEVEPISDAEQKLEQPPFDGPELKYRFGREIERQTGTKVFDYQLI